MPHDDGPICPICNSGDLEFESSDDGDKLNGKCLSCGHEFEADEELAGLLEVTENMKLMWIISAIMVKRGIQSIDLPMEFDLAGTGDKQLVIHGDMLKRVVHVKLMPLQSENANRERM